MSRRRFTRLAPILLSAWLAGGCAVGRFVVGAPASGGRGAVHPLVARRCGGCHEIPDPNAMTAVQWGAALERMKRRMKLPAEEWDTLATMGR